MDKIIYQDSNELLMQAVARNGEAMSTLIDCESGVKSAASSMIDRKLLEEYRPTDSNTAMIHLIAMGNSDQYGFNRNGDYFAGDVLEKRANTFVKFGHVFREHRNKDPKKAIGSIKYAAYDPKGMQRVELIIHIDKDKAGPEFEKAAAGEPLNFSMSCRVPNDRCSCCGNEAKTVSKYCTHLRDHMGQWDNEFKKYAFAYNDVPTFFDISRVRYPADRIARHLEYMFKNDEDGSMRKAASAGNGPIIVPSAIAAEAEGVHLGTGYEVDEQNMICKLAEAEGYADSLEAVSNMYVEKRANMMFGSYPFGLMGGFDPEELQTVQQASPGTLMRALAKKMCMMSFPGFCQYISGDPCIMEHPVARQAACELPGAFRRIRIRIVMPMQEEPNTQVFRMSSGFMAGQDPAFDKVQNIMDKAEEKFSLEPCHIRCRVLKEINKVDADDEEGKRKHRDRRVAMYKEATCWRPDPRATALADTYAEYQVRALCDMRELHGASSVTPEMLDAVVGANTARVYGM